MNNVMHTLNGVEKTAITLTLDIQMTAVIIMLSMQIFQYLSKVFF
jgi:hypothetical protein